MIKDREYMFASSFLKASDGAGTPAERLARFSEAADPAALRSAVREVYRLTSKGGGTADVYHAALCEAVDNIKSAVPDFSVFCPLLYKYDCTNIKTALKCVLRGESSEGLLLFCGTVSPEKIVAGAESSSFEGLPPHMNKAAGEALAQYRKTGEVRCIDLILDSACFADMREDADRGGVELICKTVTLRADGVNLMTSQRLASQKLPAEVAASLMKRAFVPGGDIPLSAFLAADGGCADADTVAAKVPAGSTSASAVRLAAKQKSFSEAEKVFDEAVLSLANGYRFKPFGPEVAVRYLLIREAEMTNCRIIEAGMKGGRADEMRGRLRRAYV